MNSANEKSHLIGFLYASIADMQGTIRSIDSKLGFLFVILIIPFSNLKKISDTLFVLISSTETVTSLIILYIMIAIFVVSWLSAFLILIRGVVAIDNPSKHIKECPKDLGAFYAGNLFSFSIMDTLRNRNSVLSQLSFDDNLQKITNLNAEESVIKELLFEQSKLAYIRGIKFVRQRYAYYFAILWLFSGFLLWVWKLVKVK